MKSEVIERLINNIENKPVKHDQGEWLTNGTDVFIISNDKRWSCATTGCAAGFLFLSEAEEGMVFDTESATVYSSYSRYLEFADIPDVGGTSITRWCSKIMDVDFDTAYSIFYDFGNTEHIIDRLRALLASSDISEDA